MEIYEPRLIRNHDFVEIEGIVFKPYSIDSMGRGAFDMRPIQTHAKKALSTVSIPAMKHRGLGYIIYHSGSEATWLLVRVWLDGGIVSGTVGRIDGNRYMQVTEPVVECVWEEIPAHHERNAWVRHMMIDPESPENYLQDRLEDGYY